MKAEVKHNRRWSDRDDETLEYLCGIGSSYGTIAEALGRTRSAVTMRAHELRERGQDVPYRVSQSYQRKQRRVSVTHIEAEETQEAEQRDQLEHRVDFLERVVSYLCAEFDLDLKEF